MTASFPTEADLFSALDRALEELPEMLITERWRGLRLFGFCPFIDRLSCALDADYQVMLHRLQPATDDLQPLFHGHSKPIAVQVIEGCYHSRIGSSNTDAHPVPTENSITLSAGDRYALMSSSQWHDIVPDPEAWTVLVQANQRFDPIHPGVLRPSYFPSGRLPPDRIELLLKHWMTLLPTA